MSCPSLLAWLTSVTIAGAAAFVFFAFLYAHEAYTARASGDLEW